MLVPRIRIAGSHGIFKIPRTTGMDIPKKRNKRYPVRANMDKIKKATNAVLLAVSGNQGLTFLTSFFKNRGIIHRGGLTTVTLMVSCASHHFFDIGYDFNLKSWNFARRSCDPGVLWYVKAKEKLSRSRKELLIAARISNHHNFTLRMSR